ncbi:MAG: hypothetical protein PVJ84_19395, partial [Desulfobacteraceae bacterium]
NATTAFRDVLGVCKGPSIDPTPAILHRISLLIFLHTNNLSASHSALLNQYSYYFFLLLNVT